MNEKQTDPALAAASRINNPTPQNFLERIFARWGATSEHARERRKAIRGIATTALSAVVAIPLTIGVTHAAAEYNNQGTEIIATSTGHIGQGDTVDGSLPDAINDLVEQAGENEVYRWPFSTDGVKGELMDQITDKETGAYQPGSYDLTLREGNLGFPHITVEAHNPADNGSGDPAKAKNDAPKSN